MGRIRHELALQLLELFRPGQKHPQTETEKHRTGGENPDGDPRGTRHLLSAREFRGDGDLGCFTHHARRDALLLELRSGRGNAWQVDAVQERADLTLGAIRIERAPGSVHEEREHEREERHIRRQCDAKLARERHPALPLSRSFARIVLTSTPSWRAAAALLPSTRTRVCRTTARSASASVVSAGSVSVGSAPALSACRYG